MFRYQWIVDGQPSKAADVTIHVAGSGPILVSTTSDAADGNFSPGHLSLREALMVAVGNLGHDTIAFDSALAGRTIVLEQGQLALDSNVAIVGPAGGVTIDADHRSRVFYLVDGKEASLSNMTVTGGAATEGAGVFAQLGKLFITNVVIAGNVATGWGGGVYAFNPTGALTITITNSTITGNSANGGGGIYNIFGGVTASNSIVALNIASTGPDLRRSLGSASRNNRIGGDPGFVRNPSRGADGKWGTADDDLGDLRLRAGSAAIGAGLNSLAVDASGSQLTTDLEGKARIIYGTVDIGAYEYRMIGDANYDHVVNDVDATILAGHWHQPGGWLDGDFNGDGLVDDRDASIMAAHWGETAEALSPVVVVDVPAGLPVDEPVVVDAQFIGPRQAAASVVRRRIEPYHAERALAEPVARFSSISEPVERAACDVVLRESMDAAEVAGCRWAWAGEFDQPRARRVLQRPDAAAIDLVLRGV